MYSCNCQESGSGKKNFIEIHYVSQDYISVSIAMQNFEGVFLTYEASD